MAVWLHEFGCREFQQVHLIAIWPFDSKPKIQMSISIWIRLVPSDSLAFKKIGSLLDLNEMYRSSSISKPIEQLFLMSFFASESFDSLSSPTHSSSLITFINQKSQEKFDVFLASNSYNPAGEFHLPAQKSKSGRDLQFHDELVSAKDRHLWVKSALQ